MSCTFDNQSAALVSFRTINHHNVVLGFTNPEHYKADNSPIFGVCVGRVANRIYGGSIRIDDKSFPLEINDKDNNATLHGGVKGWDKFEWTGPEVLKDGSAPHRTSYVYKHVSEHLDQGFPGKVLAQVKYTPYTDNDKSIVEIEFEATLAEDSPVDETVVSLTNHSYFNVAGDDATNCDGTELQICTDKYLVHDPKTQVPTGQIGDLPTVPADRSFFKVGESGPILDHCFIVDPLTLDNGKIDTSRDELALLVHMRHPKTNLNVQVFSTEPAFQVYTGDGTSVPQLSGEKRPFGPRSGIAVEPARPTNAANTDEWRPWVTLRKGQKYGSKTMYVAW